MRLSFTEIRSKKLVFAFVFSVVIHCILFVCIKQSKVENNLEKFSRMTLKMDSSVAAANVKADEVTKENAPITTANKVGDEEKINHQREDESLEEFTESNGLSKRGSYRLRSWRGMEFIPERPDVLRQVFESVNSMKYKIKSLNFDGECTLSKINPDDKFDLTCKTKADVFVLNHAMSDEFQRMATLELVGICVLFTKENIQVRNACEAN
jgi:hypothetical protein